MFGTNSNFFKHISFFMSIACCSMLFGCWPKSKSVEIHVIAKSDQGDPIAMAEIMLNRTLVAKTDTQGRAVLIEELEIDKRASIEIRKESNARYYAPFFHSFVVLEEGSDRYQVQGTLYSVPKPSPKEESDPLNAEVAPIENETVEEPAKENNISGDEGGELVVIEESSPAQAKNNDPATENAMKIAEKSEEKDLDAATVIRPQEIKAIGANHKSEEKDLELSDAEEEKQKIVTFYSHVGNKALADVEIYIGYEEKGQLQLACKTNRQGRCIYHLNQTAEKAPATLLARKQGHRTTRHQQALQDGDRVRLALPRGESIDVIAINKRYGYARGLEGVQVRVNGQMVGNTDQFGHFSHFYRGKAGDFVEVSLAPKEGYLPKEFVTDYIVAGPMSLVKYFAPIKPEPLRIAILPVQAAGRMEGRTLASFSGNLNQHIRAAMNRHFFTSPAFEEENYQALSGRMAKENISLGRLTKKGWQHSELKGSLDAIMIPTIIMQDPLHLEFSIVDSTGKVLVADKHQLVSYQDHNAIGQATKDLSHKIQNSFPFEGTIIAKDDESLTINLGVEAGYNVKVDDEFTVYGLQTDRLGQSKTHTKIGRVRVSHVMKDQSRVRILDTAPRSLIDVGDQVSLERQPALSHDSLQLSVIDHDNAEIISQANIYFNQNWIGSSNTEGLAKIAKAKARGRGILNVIKSGYRDFTKEVNLDSSQRIEIKMIRENAFLRVDSQPQGAEVYVDAQRVGVTPLERPVVVPSGFMKLEIKGPQEYKVFEQVLQLDEGTLDLTGDRAIRLEKNLRRQAQDLVERGDVMGAIQVLETIPNDHSDYLLGLHQAGEIYLSLLNQSAKAAEVFGRVTLDPTVRQFNDKRFIGSHINEGVALFMTGQNLEDQSRQAAVAHYQKSIEVMERTEPQLRHINRLEYPQALHNTSYYRALSYHRIWDITQDPMYLTEAHRAWKRYLDHSVKSAPLARGENFEKNATIYLRQTEAAIQKVEHRTARGN
ncbi:MAG: PEGA domain-containing protein [Oligoflexus sp.]